MSSTLRELTSRVRVAIEAVRVRLETDFPLGSTVPGVGTVRGHRIEVLPSGVVDCYVSAAPLGKTLKPRRVDLDTGKVLP